MAADGIGSVRKHLGSPSHLQAYDFFLSIFALIIIISGVVELFLHAEGFDVCVDYIVS